MKIRTAAVAAVAVALAVPGVASAARKPAAPKPLVFTDLAGDANALDQGVGPTGTATPAQAEAFDIREVKIVTDKAGTAATKILVSLKLAAAPTVGIYRVIGNIGGCAFWTEQSINPESSLDNSAVRTCDSGTTGYVYTDVSSKIDGSTITWTIPIKAFKSAGLKAGAVWEGLGADARGNQVAITAPSIDRATSASVYKVGS